MSYSKTGPNSICRKHGTHAVKYCKDPDPAPTGADLVKTIAAIATDPPQELPSELPSIADLNIIATEAEKE